MILSFYRKEKNPFHIIYYRMEIKEIISNIRSPARLSLSNLFYDYFHCYSFIDCFEQKRIRLLYIINQRITYKRQFRSFHLHIITWCLFIFKIRKSHIGSFERHSITFSSFIFQCINFAQLFWLCIFHSRSNSHRTAPHVPPWHFHREFKLHSTWTAVFIFSYFLNN